MGASLPQPGADSGRRCARARDLASDLARPPIEQIANQHSGPPACCSSCTYRFVFSSCPLGRPLRLPRLLRCRFRSRRHHPSRGCGCGARSTARGGPFRDLWVVGVSAISRDTVRCLRLSFGCTVGV